MDAVTTPAISQGGKPEGIRYHLAININTCHRAVFAHGVYPLHWLMFLFAAAAQPRGVGGQLLPTPSSTHRPI
jgi:hypothetical protein